MIVGKARIERLWMFGRLNNFGEQVLIVSMRADVQGDALLVLPLPLKAGGRCAFTDLSAYDTLFGELDLCWEPSLVISDNPRLQADLEGSLLNAGASASTGALWKTRAELTRADPALPADAWADYAFAAFRLPPGNNDVKPLALVFETRVPEKIFFPTADPHKPEKVHVHQRLYAQGWMAKRLEGWLESDSVAGEHVDVAATRRLVTGGLRVYRSDRRGERKNEDVWVKVT